VKPFVIAANSMRRYVRDRTALFFTLVLPVVLIFIIGSATSRFDDTEFPLGVVDQGSGPLAVAFERALEREPAVALERYGDAEDLAKDVRRGAIPAGIVIPGSYDAKLRSGGSVQVRLFLDQTRGFPAAVRSVVSSAVAGQGAALEAASFVSRHTGRSFDDGLAQAKRSQSLIEGFAIGVKTEVVGHAGRRSYLPPGIGYQVPSNLVLFVFITSLAGSAALIQSRQLGLTRRMLGTPTRARSILAGEALSRFTLAAFQALFIFIVGTLVFGVEWGQPLSATLIILLFVGVGTSVGMLFGTIFRTPEQASSIGAPLGIAAGMLGGCMWPLEIVPKPMQTFGHIFPHAWAMDAWIEIIGRGGGLADITKDLAVLAGFVAVLMPVAAWRLRRSIVAA
jgi:ABC-2 type transport system permease protein